MTPTERAAAVAELVAFRRANQDKANTLRIPKPKPMPIKRLYNDCETTGTDPERHGIIQWSAVITIDGKQVDRISLAMQPFKGDEIEDDALAANGITREELFSNDRLTPEEGYTELIRFLEKHVDKYNRADKYFWIGYNADFDARFTRKFFLKMEDEYFGSWFFMPILCVMVLAGYLLMKWRQDLPDFKLRTLFNYLYPDKGQEYDLEAMEGEDPWHDAVFDIERTIDVETALRGIVSKANKA